VQKEKESDIVTLIDVDFAEYRRKNDMRTIKKNCTIPSWLNFEAEKAGINFLSVLQTALKQELHIADRADSLDMVVLPSTVASCYHNCCINGGTSPENFGYHLVYCCKEYQITHRPLIHHTSVCLKCFYSFKILCQAYLSLNCALLMCHLFLPTPI
jgi:hypothetical protein